MCIRLYEHGEREVKCIKLPVRDNRKITMIQSKYSFITRLTI